MERIPNSLDPAAILDQARDAIIVHGLDGAVRYWNRSAERIFGWSASEAMGRCIQDFLCSDPRSIDEALAGVLASGEWNGKIAHVAKAGNEVLLECRWTMLRDERSSARYILSFSAERVESSESADKEKREAQSARLQRLESIGAFASGIAHDLNNVLGPIIMAVDLFKLTLKSRHELEILETVEVSAQHGAEIVKQVLSFTRENEDGNSNPVSGEDAGRSVSQSTAGLPRGNGELILIIDDEASIRMITSQILETFGYRVITACDGADGVAKYAGHRGEVAAVITDMMMPVMGGAATISVLMQLDSSVKIVATSGLNMKVAEAEALQSGVKFFLRKPFTTGTLLGVLNCVLQPET